MPLNIFIDRFWPRGQQLCKLLGIESFNMWKQFNFQRIFFGIQTWPPIHCFVHKYGRRDVMWKRCTSSWLKFQANTQSSRVTLNETKPLSFCFSLIPMSFFLEFESKTENSPLSLFMAEGYLNVSPAWKKAIHQWASETSRASERRSSLTRLLFCAARACTFHDRLYLPRTQTSLLRAQRKAGRRGRASPLQLITFRSPLPCKKRSAWGGGCS